MITRKWKLPRPDRGPKTEWRPLVKVGGTVPWGYVRSEEDPDIILPVKEELVLLEQAKIYLKTYSSREVAEWLTNNSGREISHVGLLQRINLEHKRQRALSIARYYAERYRQAEEKAKKLEGQIGNNKVQDSSSS